MRHFTLSIAVMTVLTTVPVGSQTVRDAEEQGPAPFLLGGDRAAVKVLTEPSRDKAKGRLTYRLTEGWEQWPKDKRERIVAAMDEAVAFYNRHGRFKKEIRVSYNPETPTADGHYNGHIRFGGSISTRTALHEISHTLGVGTTRKWREMCQDKKWIGERANRLLRSFDGPDAEVNCDPRHFWPYGLNYPREDGAVQRLRHVQMVEALCRDMGLPVVLAESGEETREE